MDDDEGGGTAQLEVVGRVKWASLYVPNYEGSVVTDWIANQRNGDWGDGNHDAIEKKNDF